jgi:hypothetical protein
VATIADSDLRMWRACSWALVLMLLGLGLCWMFYLPTVGKGGLFLAVGATLMPLFWEKVGTVGKMSWIAMLFLLLAVEYRAIDHEHHLNDIAQQEALRAIGNGFTGVLSDQRNGFASLITQSDKAFKKTTEQASAQFDATMNRAQENLNHMTGGKTYPMVSPIFIPLENTTNTFRLTISAEGDSPLFDVDVTLSKLPLPTTPFSATDFVSGKGLPYMTSIFLAPSLSPHRVQLVPAVTVSESGQSDFLITTLARNGTFHEKLHIRRNGDAITRSGKDLLLPWSYSCEITRDRVGRDRRTYEVSITKIPWQKFLFANGQVVPK